MFVLSGLTKRRTAAIRKKQKKSLGLKEEDSEANLACNFAKINKRQCGAAATGSEQVLVCQCEAKFHGTCAEQYLEKVLKEHSPPTPICLLCLDKLHPNGPCPTCGIAKGLSRSLKCPICFVQVHKKADCSVFNAIVDGALVDGYTCFR